MAWRLIPFLATGYFLASLDRVNVGFAALEMNKDINLGAAAFGFGAGLFFVSYCLFAVPANVMMVRIGARRWLSFVMIFWGVLATCMAFVQGPMSFYSLRFFARHRRSRLLPGRYLLLHPMVSRPSPQPDGRHSDDGAAGFQRFWDPRCRPPCC